MKFTEFIQNEIFKPRLQKHSCLAVYDPERRFRELCLEIASDKIAVVDATESSLESRQAALEALAKLGEPNPPIESLLVYVPAKKPVDEEDKMVDPFSIYAAAGAVFPENTGDEFLQLCLKMKPDYSAEIRQLFKENAQPSFAMIDAIGGGVNFPQLRAILSVESAREMLLALLAPTDKQKEALKNQNGWETEVRQLVETALKYNLKTKAKTQTAIADELWRFVLFSEFAFDLPQGLPADLRSMPRAPDDVRWLVEDLCESIRHDLKKQAVYLEKAIAVEQELNLPAICAGIEDLGTKDTFAFEERSFLSRAITGVKENDFALTRQMLSRHERSVWRGRGETQAQWSLVKAALDLIETCDDCEERLTENSRSQTALIDFYTGTLREADRLQREFEQSVGNMIAPSDLISEIVRQARSRYGRLSEKVQSVFIKHLETEGWTPANKLANSEVFDRFVGERLKDHGSKVAFFMVDALRYELGVELEKLIAEDNLVEMHTAFAQLPTVTVVGMASLLPNAKNDLSLECASGSLAPKLGDTPVTNVSQRMSVLQKKFGDRFKETTLSKFVNQNQKLASTVDLLVLRSTEIDSQLENNPETTLSLIPQTLQYIRAALHKLRTLGFNEAVIAADHGFFLNAQAEAGDVCQKPIGNWQVCAHDRIVFTARDKNNYDIFSVNADGGEMRQLTKNAGRRNIEAVVSTDNQFIAFLSDRTGETRLWRMNMDGTDARRLTTLSDDKEKAESSPYFSPDGQWIYYVFSQHGKGSIRKIPSSGGESIAVSQTDKNVFEPVASPDGKFLAHAVYNNEAASPWQIAVMSLENPSEKERFFNFPAFRQRPRWTLDSKSLISIDRIEEGNLWQTNLESGERRQITNFTAENLYRFDASPDGRFFVFSRGNYFSDAVLIER